MKITESEVRYIADLANLNLSNDEIHRLAAEMDQILTYVDKLNEIDTSGVEAMAQVLYDAEPDATLRNDSERSTFSAEVALENSPVSGAGYFKVPKVIER